MKPLPDRLPQDVIDSLNRLTAYEGGPRQNVHAKILRMFFEAIGPIPERKSFLDGPWPGPAPKLKKPRK